MQDRTCTECGAVPRHKERRRGLCSACYQRNRKAGTLPPLEPRPSLAERMDARIVVDEASGCWLWTSHLSNSGYAVIRSGRRKSHWVHRLQYERYVGPIPEGLVIDHLCRVRHCVNPAHLEPVTYRENTMRSPIAIGAINARKTHCPQGHPYTPENNYRHRGSGRQCRPCVLARKAQARKEVAS